MMATRDRGYDMEKRCIECYSIHEFEPNSKQWECAIKEIWTEGKYLRFVDSALHGAIGAVLRSRGWVAKKIARDTDGYKAVVYELDVGGKVMSVSYAIYWDGPYLPHPLGPDLSFKLRWDREVAKDEWYATNRQVSTSVKRVFNELKDQFVVAQWAWRAGYLFTEDGRLCPV